MDYGQRRNGFAVGDDCVRLATPVAVVEARSDHARLAELAKMIDSQGPDALVIGLPLNMDDSEGPAAKNVRAFADQAAGRFDLPVHLVDERLTSFAADQRLRERDLTRRGRKQRRDALAAAVILETFFQQTPGQNK